MYNTGDDTSEIQPELLYRPSINIGDIIYINNTNYICLYCDKAITVLYKNEHEVSFNNFVLIPSKTQYYKVGVASREELQESYEAFLLYKGMLRSRSIDNIEKAMRRMLIE